MKYISFILLFCLTTCTETKEYATIEQRIVKAEQVRNNPLEVISLLKEISSESLDNSLSLRWCILFGKAADELNKNELLPIINFTKALKYCDMPQDRAWINYLLGTAYYEQQNGSKALEFYKKALIAVDEYNDFYLKGKINFSIGTIYLAQNMLDESKSKYEQSAKAYKEIGNLQGEIRAKTWVSYCLIHMDSIQTALQYAIETEKYSEKGDDFAKSYSANSLAHVYEALGNYDLAEKYTLQAIALDTINTASNYLLLAGIYTKNKKYEEAQKALNVAETANFTNKFAPMTLALFRSELYKEEGNMEAYEIYHQKYLELREYFEIPVYAHQIAELEKELSVNKSEISNLTRMQNFLVSNFGFGFIVFSIILIFMVILIRNQKKKVQKSYEQIKKMLDNEVFSKMDEIDKNLNRINELSK